MFFSRKKKAKTRIVVQYDVGFPNTLCIRGEGIEGLNWEKGIPLDNTKPDEWVWETDAPFSSAEFKVLINDSLFEEGENHTIHPGSSICINPKFPVMHQG